MRLRTKLLVLVGVLWIVPLSVLAIYADRVFQLRLREQANIIAGEILGENEGFLSLYLDEIEQTVGYLVGTAAVRDALTADDYDDIYELLPTVRRVMRSVDEIIHTRSDIDMLDLYGSNGFGMVRRTPAPGGIDTIDEAPWMRGLAIDDLATPQWVYDRSSRSLRNVRLVRYVDHPKTVGLAVASVPVFRLESVLRTHNRNAAAQRMVVDARSGETIAPSGAMESTGLPDDAITVRSQIGDSPLSLVMRIPLETVTARALRARFTIGVALVVIALCSMLVWVRFIRSLTEPLTALSQSMNAYTPDRGPMHLEATSNDEIGTLTTSFGRMTERIERLVSRVSEEYQLRRDAEWDRLTAQLNPHFLGNTLHAISGAARKRNAPEVVEMIGKVSRLFQTILRSQGRWTTVREELSFLDAYLDIHRLRFGNQFTAEVSAQPETLNAHIPRFLLQPVIENAVVHGTARVARPGKVSVHIRMETPTTVSVRVSDNGPGDGYRAMLRAVEYPADRPPGHVGLGNVVRRLQLISGIARPVQFVAEPGVGTTVTMMIPVDGWSTVHVSGA